ncbi:DinB family protein [Virgibacillus siamensis]|uniref:DinB family protein n=1 Tax=Virgibacillus siamensis TaxID=480071 RepID=UPI00098641D1|nr:DinB family protein [Virgibacillus siamensis]
MIHAQEVLLDQLLANANDPSWYTSFQESVDGVEEEDAFWKPDEKSHSIAEIVQHLIYWNDVWQNRYVAGDVHAVPSVKDNANTFHTSENTGFLELKERLLEILLHWQNLLTIEKLESNVKNFPVQTEWWGIIANAATHNAYHIGQITYIRKMKKA